MLRLPYVSPQVLVLLGVVAGGGIVLGVRPEIEVDWAGREAHLARPDNFARVAELALPHAQGPHDPQPTGLRLLLTPARLDVDDVQLWLQAGPERPDAPSQHFNQSPAQATALAAKAAEAGATAALLGADLTVPFARVVAAGHAAQGGGLAVRALVAVGDEVQTVPLRFLADCDPQALTAPGDATWGDVFARVLEAPAAAGVAECNNAP
jgi:hypothetical protein